MELVSTADSNLTTSTMDDLDCPEFTSDDSAFLKSFSFWVEGVLQTGTAALGIIGNTIASIIISRKEMRNSFNLLLVSLACFDSTYLFGSILESFRKTFDLATRHHIILFPYLLYPFNQVAISGSIFMTVAIAWERYIAVHYPLDYNQAMNDTNAMRKRLVKYVGPVFILAFLFNIVKFFEADISYKAVYDEAASNESDQKTILYYEPALEVAELRTHPVYSAYNNWSRLLILGIFPFVLLVFFNTKIYKDIVERRRRRLRTHRVPRASDSNVMTDFLSLPPVASSTALHLLVDPATSGDQGSKRIANGSSGKNKKKTQLTVKRPKRNKEKRKKKKEKKDSKSSENSGSASSWCKRVFKTSMSSKKSGDVALELASNRHHLQDQQPKALETNFDDIDPATIVVTVNLPNNNRSSSTTSSTTSTKRTLTINEEVQESMNIRNDEGGDDIDEEEGEGEGEDAERADSDDLNESDCGLPIGNQSRSHGQLQPPSPSLRASPSTPSAMLLQSSAGDPNRIRRRQVHNINERRRRFEDNLAAIFMGFVLVFLVCHFPRLILNIHELFTIRNAVRCTDHGLQGFPLWSLVLISISHFLLVLNSSINILIYCLLSSKFREECVILMRRISRRNANPANNLVI